MKKTPIHRRLRFLTYAPMIGFVIVAVIGGLFFSYSTYKSYLRLEKEETETARRTDMLQELSRHRDEIKNLVLLYQTTHDEVHYQNALSRLGERQKYVDDIDKFFQNPTEPGVPRNFRAGSLKSLEVLRNALSSIRAGDPYETEKNFHTFAVLSKMNSARLQDLVTLSEMELQSANLSMKDLIHRSFAAIVLFLLISMTVVGFIIHLHERQIYKPLQKLQAGFNQLDAGKLPQLRLSSQSSAEIKALYEDFNRMSDEINIYREKLVQAEKAASRASDMKSQFLANMSHEIRTPLNSIIGFSSLLSEMELSTRAREYVSKISKNNRILLNLVNDVLDISKIESGQMKLYKSVFRISDILDRLQSVMEPQVAKRPILFQIEYKESSASDQVLGDELRVEQVLLNLLGNAAKFTDRGFIQLKASRDQIQDCFVFEVTDSGPGIAEERLPHLFHRFSQVDSSVTKKFGGTGLGLAISKQLVELMDGKISVQSQLGEGSSFRVELPLPATETNLKPRLVATERHWGHEQTPATVLLVDDVEENRILISASLKNFNLQIQEASNGLTALELFKSKRYDLVLLDMQMPIMDGYSAVAKMREFESLNGRDATRIIALSAYSLESDIKRSLANGCDDYITKPIVVDALREKIRTYLTDHTKKLPPTPIAVTTA